ncbi:hypothetical protein K492DRAFT_177674 [Lichtheimia hyalospora FSU 10163]|nr:hypothetical protein K492DRAFT_177674 [Lichtheimia hyalospora FSU 10163]
MATVPPMPSPPPHHPTASPSSPHYTHRRPSSTTGQKRGLTRVISSMHPDEKPSKTRILSPTRAWLRQGDIVHKSDLRMFTISLGSSKSSMAALCYLPTRVQSVVEFYHTEIPAAYRHRGIGDMLVKYALQWAERSGLLVIPTCPFVKRYLKHHQGCHAPVVSTEQEGVDRMVRRLPTPKDEKDNVLLQ